jgi:hypothetical protein
MKPSFFSLYKRGNYIKRSEDNEQDGKVRETKREERERFAMSLIAFCLKYDEVFRRHFFDKICEVRDEEYEKKWKGAEIEVERKLWGDMALIKPALGVFVIEGKIHAPLQKKQNPAEKEFWQDGGYGSAIKKYEPFQKIKQNLNYIVFGYGKKGDEKIVPQKNSEGIICKQKWWEDLEVGFPNTSLAADLADCLSLLRVDAFYFRKIKTMKIKQSLYQAGEAYQVLEGIKAELKNKALKFKFSSYANDEEGWGFIYSIHETSESRPGKQENGLLKKVKPNRNGPVGEFGYYGTEGSKLFRQVWLYCCDNAQAKKLKKDLESKLTEYSVNLDWDDDHKVERFLKITEKRKNLSKDFDWFNSVFRCLDNDK